MRQLTLSEAPKQYHQAAQTDSRKLLMKEPDGSYRAAEPREILAIARELVEETFTPGIALNQPTLIKDFLRVRLNHSLEHEVFGMVLLDSQFRLIEYLEPFRGTINQASVYPREVVKLALKANAAAIVIAHNHPSGSLEPSQADLSLTRVLKEALQLVDVRLIDHVLVAGNQTYSFAERGQV